MEKANSASQIFPERTVHVGRLSTAVWQMLVLGAIVGSWVPATSAQTATEYQVKAAFLYNFAKFVEWPSSSFSSPSAPLQICVFGRDPFGEELRNITNEKMVNGHRLEVRRAMDLQQARSCHILFVAFSGASVKSILEGLHGASVLTVGDSKGFAEQGGMINFILENDRVKFEVSSKAAEKAGLKISSKLLSLAKSVIV